MDTGDVVTMVIYVQRKQLYVNVVAHPQGRRKFLAGRVVLERSSDPVDSDLDVMLTECAYAVGLSLKA